MAILLDILSSLLLLYFFPTVLVQHKHFNFPIPLSENWKLCIQTKKKKLETLHEVFAQQTYQLYCLHICRIDIQTNTRRFESLFLVRALFRMKFICFTEELYQTFIVLLYYFYFSIFLRMLLWSLPG